MRKRIHLHRLMDDKFSVAFEFYINVGHALVERAGVSQPFAEVAWQQVEAGVRGKLRWMRGSRANWRPGSGPDAEKFKNEYLRPLRRRDFDLPALLYLDVTITTCARGTILCSRLRRSPKGCGRSRRFSRPIRDSSSTSITAAGDSRARNKCETRIRASFSDAANVSFSIAPSGPNWKDVSPQPADPFGIPL